MCEEKERIRLRSAGYLYCYCFLKRSNLPDMRGRLGAFFRMKIQLLYIATFRLGHHMLEVKGWKFQFRGHFSKGQPMSGDLLFVNVSDCNPSRFSLKALPNNISPIHLCDRNKELEVSTKF